MCVKMETIDVFYNSSLILERKRPLYILSYLTIIIFVILLALLISIFYKYNPYKKYLGRVIITESDFYIKMQVEENEIPLLNNNFIINNENYSYKITGISDIAYIGDNLKKYYEVTIESNIDDNLIIQNNIININLKLPKTTLFKELIKKVKKGLK